MRFIQADTLAGHQGAVIESVTKTSCSLINTSWDVDRAAIESFLLSLAAYVRERLEQVSASIYLLLADTALMLWLVSLGVLNRLGCCTFEFMKLICMN